MTGGVPNNVRRLPAGASTLAGCKPSRTTIYVTLPGSSCSTVSDYFEAHEVWEDLWHDCPSADRRFVQSLIQAAVALYHWGRGNAAGAQRLFDSGRNYMAPYRPRHLGLDVADVLGRRGVRPCRRCWSTRRPSGLNVVRRRHHPRPAAARVADRLRNPPAARHLRGPGPDMTDDQAALAAVRRHGPAVPAAEPGPLPAGHPGAARLRAAVPTADGRRGRRPTCSWRWCLLQPGWEKDYDGRPPIHRRSPVSGRVTQHEQLPDGRYNLRLKGLSRVRLGDEVADPEAVPDGPGGAGAGRRAGRPAPARGPAAVLGRGGAAAVPQRTGRPTSSCTNCSTATRRSAPPVRHARLRPAAAAGARSSNSWRSRRWTSGRR